jgi:Helix-turn-helix domain.
LPDNLDLIRSFKYPLHPNAEQERKLLHWLWMLSGLYNAALQERRDAYKIAGKTLLPDFGQVVVCRCLWRDSYRSGGRSIRTWGRHRKGDRSVQCHSCTHV